MTISPSSAKAPPLERRSSTLKDEIVDIWAQVQARVIQLAGDDSKIQTDLSIEDVLSYLEKAQDMSSKKDSSIRSAFERTLQFIDTVGGVVAGGAGEVSLFPLQSNIPDRLVANLLFYRPSPPRNSASMPCLWSFKPGKATKVSLNR
jgi:hypothetical protein